MNDFSAHIGGRSYVWRIQNGAVAVANLSGDELNPTSAQVLMSLGGSEPNWLIVVEALNAACRASPGQETVGVQAAVVALGQSKTHRSEIARTTDDRSVLVALAALGTTQVGANPMCDVRAWELIMNSRDPKVRQSALRNNEVLPANLWNFHDQETRVRVARNPQCPDHILSSLATQEPPIRSAVAGNIHTSAELLTVLAMDDEMVVRRAVATNPNCPLACFRVLSRDPQAAVRVAIVTNPAIPVRLVARRIWSDPTPSVHPALATRIDLSVRKLGLLEHYSRSDPITQYKLVCSRVSQHPQCSKRLAKRMSKVQERLNSLTDEQKVALQPSRRGQASRKLPPGVLLQGVLVAAALVIGLAFVASGKSIARTSGISGALPVVLVGVVISGFILAIAYIRRSRSPFRGLFAPLRIRALMSVAVIVGILLLAIPAHGYNGSDPAFYVLAGVLAIRLINAQLSSRKQPSERTVWLLSKFRISRSRGR